MRLADSQRTMRLQEPERAKILKPLMEKRRRDRINVSLSRLQSLVLPAQVLTAQRQLYLSFQDGFSTCLHRAARFLESGEKTQWLTPTLDAALSRRGMDPCSVSIRLKKTPHSALRELTQRRTISVSAITNSYQSQKSAPRPPAQSAECGQSTKPSLGPQSLWRPWP
uniref:BHLH domain-containing protein n=1 Tax=Periophthalmus magnuspinnatus TaxID=409849 RepID=A0A3B4APF8_9GOBI